MIGLVQIDMDDLVAADIEVTRLARLLGEVAAPADPDAAELLEHAIERGSKATGRHLAGLGRTVGDDDQTFRHERNSRLRMTASSTAGTLLVPGMR